MIHVLKASKSRWNGIHVVDVVDRIRSYPAAWMVCS